MAPRMDCSDSRSKNEDEDSVAMMI
jgi:hypothetical protein